MRRRTGVLRSGAAVLALAAAGAAPVCAQESGGAPDTLRLRLGDAVRMATERGARLDMAQLGDVQAAARVTQARSALLPQVGLTAQDGQRSFNTATFGIDFPSPPGEPPLFDPNGQVIGPIGTPDVRATLTQTLFDWSAVERVRSAKSALAASRSSTAATRESLAAGAARAYVRGLQAESRMAAVREDMSLARDLVRTAKNLLDAGVGVKLDVTRAEAQLATMQAKLIGARNQASQARLALLRSLDLPLDRPVVLVDTVVSGASGVGEDVDAAVAAALARRSDVVALDQRIQAASHAVSAVRAERLPRVSLGADDGWIGREEQHLLNTYDWSVRVSVPAFSGFRTSARLDEEHAQVSLLEAERHELREQVALQVRAALLDLSDSEEQVSAARSRLELAQEEYGQAQERFEAGVAGSAEVTESALRLSDARSAYVDAVAASRGARVALWAAEGKAGELR